LTSIKGQPQKENLAAICQRKPNNTLVGAECSNLTGGLPDSDGFAHCQNVDLIPQAAYIRTGLHILAQAATLDGLLEAVTKTEFAADDFRIDFHSLYEQHRLQSRQSIMALADVIPSYPNLNHPKHRFLLLERGQGLWFGEVKTECQRSYKNHDTKPYRTSTSLSSQLARALVNLVVPNANSLVDPCCGTGSILLEAQALGIRAFGADRNKRIAGMARQNLAHFGYQAEIAHADISAYRQTADALVTDLPYGRLLGAAESAIRPILERGKNLAPVAIFVAGSNITEWLDAAGYDDIKIYTITKHNRVKRYIHRAQTGQ
jgi:tRNA G10  N-methylase Trm11